MPCRFICTGLLTVWALQSGTVFRAIFDRMFGHYGRFVVLDRTVKRVGASQLFYKPYLNNYLEGFLSTKRKIYFVVFSLIINAFFYKNFRRSVLFVQGRKNEMRIRRRSRIESITKRTIMVPMCFPNNRLNSLSRLACVMPSMTALVRMCC